VQSEGRYLTQRRKDAKTQRFKENIKKVFLASFAPLREKAFCMRGLGRRRGDAGERQAEKRHGGSEKMVEITIDVPKDIKDVVAETGKAIYVEALKEVAARRIAYIQQQLEDLRENDDWIEWTYLTKAAEELSYKIQKLRLLTGK
jgi:hypothetical protein